MRVGIATDHGGFILKEELLVQLRAAGHDVVDFGAHELNPSDDYPDIIVPLAVAVATGDVARGIAICGSGVGASVCANKVPGVRAGLFHDHFSAQQGVEDDPDGLATQRRRLQNFRHDARQTPAERRVPDQDLPDREGGCPSLGGGRGLRVPSATFWQWIKQGDFGAAVPTAEAAARVATEVELRRQNPGAWLGRSAGSRQAPIKAKPGSKSDDTEGERLNYRRERFILEYLQDGNGTQAAIRARYLEKGAEVHAHLLLRNPKVLDKIRESPAPTNILAAGHLPRAEFQVVW